MDLFANFPPSSSSNAVSSPQSDGQPMNAPGVTFEKRFALCPVTEAAGNVIKRREIPGFSLSEMVYAKGLFLSTHRHAHAYLSFILSGSYVERYSEEELLCSEGALRFLPPDELHENDYKTAVRCLLVKIEPLALDRLGDQAPVLSSPGEVEGFASAWLAHRMYREFLAEDNVAPLAVEGVLLEILAQSARAFKGNGGGNAPLWLRRVREALEDSYLLAPSLAELAAIGGVHTVHLSREFRKHYQTTIGEFIRKRRIEHACELLAKSSMSLSEIAMACSFSDQSHFCAMFKSHTGLTPAKFRDMSGRP